MLVFGAGCLWFAPVQKPLADGKEGQAEFLNSVRSELERIDNISNIEINAGWEKAYGTYLIIDKQDKKIAAPVIYGASIEFDIFLPFRVQEEVHEKADVERFKVVITFGYYTPIAYIYYEIGDSEARADPSSAVVILRKFLEKRLDASRISFGCIGPSPFHANFYAVPSDEVSETIVSDVSKKGQGYASLVVHYPASQEFKLPGSMSSFTEALSTFYQLSNLRADLLASQRKAVLNATYLMERNPVGRIADLRSTFQVRSEIDDLRRNSV